MKQLKQVTSAQLKLIHTLLSQQNIMEHKRALCFSFSDGRTDSTRELTLNEAKHFIQYLKDDTERDTIIRRIWHLAYESNIIYGDSPDDKAMNAVVLNKFAKERGTVKKPLYQQSITELKRTQKQFESIFKKMNERQALNDYIRYIEHCNIPLIEDEMYEKAAYNQNLIKEAKATPGLAIQYFKRNPQIIEFAKQLQEEN